MLLGTVGASELRLELPDPLVTGVEQQATLVLEGGNARPQELLMPDEQHDAVLSYSGSHSTSIINGRQTLRLGIMVRPLRDGPVVIPSIGLRLTDGTTLQAPSATSQAATLRSDLPSAPHLLVTAPDGTETLPGQPLRLLWTLALPAGGDLKPLQWPPEPPSGWRTLRSEDLGHGFVRVGASETSGTFLRLQRIASWVTSERIGAARISGRFPVALDSFFNRQVQQIDIQPLEIRVGELPLAGRPPDFTGLIGPLALAAELERSRIASGEGTVLVVQLSGPQAALLTRLAPPLVDGLRIEALDEAGEPRDSQRRLRFQVVPAAPGNYRISIAGIAYYDTTSGYTRTPPAEVQLEVLPGRVRSLATPSAATPSPSSINTPAETLALPPPERRSAWAPGPQTTLLGLGGGVLLGAGAAWLLRPRRSRIHRGRALTQALQREDLAAAARVAQSLLAELPAEHAETTALRRALTDLERARFGGQSLEPTTRQTLARWENRP
jgi:hypothetical protein